MDLSGEAFNQWYASLSVEQQAQWFNMQLQAAAGKYQAEAKEKREEQKERSAKEKREEKATQELSQVTSRKDKYNINRKTWGPKKTFSFTFYFRGKEE